MQPFFMAYGTKDTLGGFQEFADRLNECPQKNHVTVLKNAGHAFANVKKWEHWLTECIEWINKVF